MIVFKQNLSEEWQVLFVSCGTMSQMCGRSLTLKDLILIDMRPNPTRKIKWN